MLFFVSKKPSYNSEKISLKPEEVGQLSREYLNQRNRAIFTANLRKFLTF